ncbi:MAG TPA: CPBP family intramembrane metalloprotease [Paenalcaligenes hominis]|uniref:CPBP family intramembrane metalloprotease n=1 Tax=Paenalcaligenes hominis TaxID=643674 RepID=A0A9D2VIB8_9BURK|nr:CPBP family intramembrane glutamic endopeptidase [Paenalcaligenes hominis]NJB64813.1 hypothetical protein [Paenalcaligenes hominis]GGE58782.1 hypothetical protein GCM10007278_03790 [Paenalcaligenes hominis]HJH25065.1 CPBP family intramembrane metalloprotease [Paenalcaligenes hominis]
MSQTPSFKHELRDFFSFLRAPNLAPRLKGQDLGQGWHTDWTNGLGVKRIVQWALVLWLVNLTVFGPLAAGVATSTGTQHRLDLSNIPWKQAILWAPLIEEMVFRYLLRRPSQFLWLLPVTLWCLFNGPQALTIGLVLAVVVLLYVRPVYGAGRPSVFAAIGLGKAWPRRWYVFYARHFGWVFYTATLLFAALHLYNFKFDQIDFWMLPMLILPQFMTGLVLGWLRVRRGIGASIILHAVFNAGPILVIMAIVRLMPIGH